MSQLTLSGLDKYQPTRVLVENNTGSDIAALKAVSLNNMGTVYPQVVLGNPSVKPIFGITIAPILHADTGQVTTLGIVYDLNTSPWTAGTTLYSDASGNLQPTALNFNDPPIATVLRQDAVFGVLFILPLVSQYHGAYGFLNYKGTWDASTGAYPPSPVKGDYYIISVAGTMGGHAYSVGDWAAFDGTKWDYVDNTTNPPAISYTSESFYNEITAVPSGPTVTIQTWIAPIGKISFLANVAVSGTNIAEYAVLVNGIIIDKRRTWFGGGVNEYFNFLGAGSGIPLNVGDIITVTVNHWRPSLGDFNSKIVISQS